MQAHKTMFLLDHSFWQDCRFGVAATIWSYCNRGLKGRTESGCRQRKPPKGGIWRGASIPWWKVFLNLSTVSSELAKSKVKSKCISRTCHKEVPMAISSAARARGKRQRGSVVSHWTRPIKTSAKGHSKSMVKMKDVKKRWRDGWVFWLVQWKLKLIQIFLFESLHSLL